MKFVQAIEFRGSKEEFERLMDRYQAIVGAETTVRSARLFEDRDEPGVFVELVEFDSYESAMANSEHPGTQRWAQEAAAVFRQAKFGNWNVVGEYTV